MRRLQHGTGRREGCTRGPQRRRWPAEGGLAGGVLAGGDSAMYSAPHELVWCDRLRLRPSCSAEFPASWGHIGVLRHEADPVQAGICDANISPCLGDRLGRTRQLPRRLMRADFPEWDSARALGIRTQCPTTWVMHTDVHGPRPGRRGATYLRSVGDVASLPGVEARGNSDGARGERLVRNQRNGERPRARPGGGRAPGGSVRSVDHEFPRNEHTARGDAQGEGR